MAGKIDIRQRETGTLLGSFYTHLEPDDVRQRLTAQGMRAFMENVGIYIPEINDPDAMPFYNRPDITVGEITAIEPSAYQLPNNPGTRVVVVGQSDGWCCSCCGFPLARSPLA